MRTSRVFVLFPDESYLGGGDGLLSGLASISNASRTTVMSLSLTFCSCSCSTIVCCNISCVISGITGCTGSADGITGSNRDLRGAGSELAAGGASTTGSPCGLPQRFFLFFCSPPAVSIQYTGSSSIFTGSLRKVESCGMLHAHNPSRKFPGSQVAVNNWMCAVYQIFLLPIVIYTNLNFQPHKNSAPKISKLNTNVYNAQSLFIKSNANHFYQNLPISFALHHIL